MENSIESRSLDFVNGHIYELLESSGLDRGVLYKCVKIYMKKYIEQTRDESFDYDVLDKNKLLMHLKCLRHDERRQILKFVIALLDKEGQEYLKNACIDQYNKYAMICDVKGINWKNFLSKMLAIILRLTSLNHFSMLASVVLFFIIISISLLPYEWPSAYFTIKYYRYSESFILNHFINVAAFLTGTGDNTKIEAENWIGVLLVILVKIVALVIGANYLIQITGKRIQTHVLK